MKVIVCPAALVLSACLALSTALVNEGDPKAIVKPGEPCIYAKDATPCKDFADGNYHICDQCDLGYFAQCVNSELVMIKPCPVHEGEDGKTYRLLFDSHTETCERQSPSCICQRDCDNYNWCGRK